MTPGFVLLSLRYARYTFDYFDLIASLVGVAAAYLVAVAMIKRSPSSESL